MMWQEARKQERKIRGLLVDFKKRAERRKDYYEKIKADPTQFLQLHGRPCKIHLDPAIAIAADSPANIMPWQGNQDILIDRFDVRAHLDYIPEIKSKEEEDLDYDERHINYERYRILVQNDFLGVSENKFLHQLAIEEQFGPVEKTGAPPIEGKKKVPGAAIGYNYNEGTVVSSPTADSNNSDQEDEEEDEEDSDVDFDLCVDINKIGSQQAHEMNACAHIYGMTSNDFFSFLTKDVEEAENLKIAREREEEKAMYSVYIGRKSRRERRAYREKKLLGRKLSPPSYASKIPTDKDLFIKSPSKSVSKSRSRSVSPVNAGQITYITSFGGEEQDPALQAPKPSIPQKEEFVYKRTVRYRSRTRSRSPKRRVTYRGRSRSRSRDRNKSSSQSRRTRSHSRSRRSRSRGQRSRSPCPKSRSRRSHSRSNYRRSPGNQSHYRRHHNSRSRTRSKSPYKMNINTAKKSKSPSPSLRSVEVPAPPVITRYYGRHRNNSSSSELELSDSEKESSEKNMSLSEKNNRSCLGNSISRNKQLSLPMPSKLTPQEKLKKKMQILLNRQYKADKRAERVRLERAEQERQDREDEMREISIKMRRRERQKRHQYYEYSESTGDGENDGSSRSSRSVSSTSSPEPDSRYVEDKEKNKEKLRVKKSKSDEEKERQKNSKEKEMRSRGSSRDRKEERRRGSSRNRDDCWDNGNRSKDDWEKRVSCLRGNSRDKDNRSRYDNRDRGSKSRRDSRDRGRRSSRERNSRYRGDSSKGDISKVTRPLVDY